MQTNPLIEQMLHDPLKFSDTELDQLIRNYQLPNGNYDLTTGFEDLRECIRRIYDLNESQLRETSNANEGILGKLNKRSTEKRKSEFNKKVQNQNAGKSYKRIYAEGDSWFQFPVFVTDIIDWLNKRDDYLIFSEAYGGDWITNIIYEGQYISSLTTFSPDVFLLSGGGNDLVGNNRLAVMVSNQNNLIKYNSPSQFNDPSLSEDNRTRILTAQKFITRDFYAFIWTIKAQYKLLFSQLYSADSKHKDMLTITQGYAYPFPKIGANFTGILQPIVNTALDSGGWLSRPMMIKGILNPEDQRNIVMAMIYEFNKMLTDLATAFDKVYFIDCREVPKNQHDWYDELHLKSEKFKIVANAFSEVIDNPGKFPNRIINAAKL